MTGALEAPYQQFTNKRLRQLLLPLLVEQCIIVGVSFFDAFLLSSIHQDAYSAISLVDMISQLAMQLYMAVGAGGAIIAAQYLGKRDREGATHTARQSAFFVLLISTLLMLVMLFFGDLLLRFVYPKVTASIRGYSSLYLKLTALSFPAHALFSCSSSLLYAQSNSKASMIASMLMYLLKLLLNLLFILVFRMGVLGIGLATLLSRLLGAFMVTRTMLRKDAPIHYEGPYDPAHLWRADRRIFKVALPSGIENTLFLFGKLVIGTIFATFPSAMIAANAAANTLSTVINMPLAAINLGIVTVVSQCMGGGHVEEAEANTKNLMKLQYLAQFSTGLLLIIFMRQAVGLLNLSPEASGYAMSILRVYCVLSIIFEPLSFGLPNALRAAGDNRFTMYTVLFSVLVLRVGFSYLFVYAFGMDINGIWYAMYVDWVARALIFIHRFRSGRWKSCRLV